MGHETAGAKGVQLAVTALSLQLEWHSGTKQRQRKGLNTYGQTRAQ
jgi:hypothetical protein